MPQLDVTVATVDNASGKGTVMPALTGRPATFLTTTTTTAVTLQKGGGDWVSPGDGFAEFLADAKWYVLILGASEADIDPGPGAGHPIQPGAYKTLSVRAGERIRAKAAT
jgi:hypothetical protein